MTISCILGRVKINAGDRVKLTANEAFVTLTIYNYRLQLEKHVYPDIGQLEMQGIKAGDINQLLRKHQAASDSLSTPIKVYTIVKKENIAMAVSI